MKRCPITYDVIPDTVDYSERGLHLLAPQLKTLHPLDYSADEQRREALARVGKMSIQGVQKKLSAQLKISAGYFELVDQSGHYILKPQSDDYPELPENEALTMTLASMIDIEVPVHGLLYSKDHSMTYFIKRFDRGVRQQKMPVEDFSQLLLLSRDTKYESSMEKIISVIFQYCSFPKIEAVKLFRRTVFNFLIGNEDMHLKNFSLITRGKKIELAPVYDLLNTTIALKGAKEEMALPLKGKKRQLTANDFFHYLAQEKLQLTDSVIQQERQRFIKILPAWRELIECSFLSAEMKQDYLKLLNERATRLNLQ